MDNFSMVVAACKRAEALEDQSGLPRTNRMTRVMDLEFADRCIPMDWEALLGADDYTFAHDVFGITRHMDRAGKVLADGFVPRCAKR